MKLKIILLTSSLCLMTMASAQRFSYGVKGGVDINTSAKPAETDACAFGLFMQAGGRLYFQPEAYYCLQFNEKSSYIRIPLLAGYQLVDWKVIGLHMTAGPTYNKQLSSGTKGAFTWGFGGGVDLLRTMTVDVRYNFKKENNSVLINTSRVNVTVGVRL